MGNFFSHKLENTIIICTTNDLKNKIKEFDGKIVSDRSTSTSDLNLYKWSFSVHKQPNSICVSKDDRRLYCLPENIALNDEVVLGSSFYN